MSLLKNENQEISVAISDSVSLEKTPAAFNFSFLKHRSPNPAVMERVEVSVKIAQTRSEIMRCQYLIAESYNRYYKIFFSTDIVNLDALIEPYPHQYLMAQINGELVGCFGLYQNNTYVEKFGNVTDQDILGAIPQSSDTPKYNVQNKKELTKLVIQRDYLNTSLAHFLAGAAHSEAFLNQEKNKQGPILVSCAKTSVFRHIHDNLEIKTRFLKTFPIYGVHQFYRTERSPMESRLILPELDIPETWYKLKLPGTYTIEINRTSK